MSSVIKAIGDVRRHLVFPDEDKPSDGVIAEYLIEAADELVTEMNQTDQDWFISSAVVDVSPFEDTYILDEKAPGYGKARDLWTLDEADTTHRRRPVKLVDFVELTRDYAGGDPALSSAKHSAMAASVIYDQAKGQNQIVFAPVPSQAAQYKLVYEPAVVRPGAKEETLFRLEQFDAYVARLAALACIDHAEWRMLDEKATERRRENLRRTFIAFVERGDDLFRRHKFSNRNVNDYKRRGFGQKRWRR